MAQIINKIALEFELNPERNDPVKPDQPTSKRLSRSKKLAGLYKRAESIQQSLLQISELASSATELERFYPKVHQIVTELMAVKNFFLAFRDSNSQAIKIEYLFDEVDNLGVSRIPSSVLEYGLTGWVLRNGKTLLIDKTQNQQMVNSGEIVQLGEAAASWLGVPLHRDGKVIGVLVLQSYDEQLKLTEQDSEILTFVSQHIVHAIDRVRQKELMERTIKQRTQALKKSNYELKQQITRRENYERVQNALIEISELTCAKNQMARFYQRIHEILDSLLYAKNFNIALLSENGKSLDFPYYVDDYEQIAEVRQFSRAIIEYVMRDGSPVRLSCHDAIRLVSSGEIDVESSILHHARSYGFNAFLGAPLLMHGQVRGVIAVQSYHHNQEYHLQDLELMRYVSNHIALAIERMLSEQALARSNEELERLVKARTQALATVNQDLHQEIEERKKIEEKLYYDAHHDNLTGLPNRAMFNDKLNQAVNRHLSLTRTPFLLLFIDLDRFKLINDTFGHLTGDQFLIEVAQRIERQLCEKCFFARLGGDEFVILIQNENQIEVAEEMATNINCALARAFVIDGKEIYAGSSIGITSSCFNYDKATHVLRDADAAMYQAKNLGRGRFVIFDESLHQALIDKLSLETELRKALKQQQIDFVFSPVNAIAGEQFDGEVAEEALVRWQHPERGLLKPRDFIELAEETGVIFDIDHRALETACERLRQWQLTGEHKLMMVNLCGNALRDPRQLNKMIDTIKSAGINTAQLVLEFPEQSLGCEKTLLNACKRLHNLGARIALDDFGAGSGGLNLLFAVPFDFVKVDARIVHGMVNNHKQRSFMQTVLSIGQQLGFAVIAEGVETIEQLDKLVQVECPLAQGRYFSPDIPQRNHDAEESLDFFSEFHQQAG